MSVFTQYHLSQSTIVFHVLSYFSFLFLLQLNLAMLHLQSLQVQIPLQRIHDRLQPRKLNRVVTQVDCL